MSNGSVFSRMLSRPIAFFFVMALLGASPAVLAEDEAGTVKTLKGTVSVERAGQKTLAAVGVKVMASDRILTGADSSVGITLRDNTLLSAGPNSILVLNRFVFDSTTHAGAVDATVKRGSLSVVSGKIAKASPDKVVFSTSTVSLGVRGTEFIIEAGSGEGQGDE